MRVTVKIGLRPDTPVKPALHDIRDHQIFIQVAPQGITGGLVFIVNSEQEGCKTHICEIYLGRLNDPFADVLIKGWQMENDVRGLKDAEPILDGGDRNTYVV